MTETERAADACQSYCQEMGISYFRFNIPLEKKVEMVIQDVESVVELLLRARQYMQDSPQLREFLVDCCMCFETWPGISTLAYECSAQI